MNKLPRLSAVMICQDENEIVTNPIEQLYDHVNEFIIVDGGSKDTTLKVIKEWKNKNDSDNKIRVFQNIFNQHFADQKNIAISKVKSVWVINVDADELFDNKFIDNLIEYTTQNKYDVYGIPRVNTIDGKDTGVFPDYQLRLFKSYCRFIFPVHEELVGWQDRLDLPDNVCMYHNKSSIRQKTQDSRYISIEERHANFMRSDIKDEEEEEEI